MFNSLSRVLNPRFVGVEWWPMVALIGIRRQPSDNVKGTFWKMKCWVRIKDGPQVFKSKGYYDFGNEGSFVIMTNMQKPEEDIVEATVNGLLESLESTKPIFKNSRDAYLAALGELEDLAQTKNLSVDKLILEAENSSIHDLDLIQAIALKRRIEFLKSKLK